MERVAGGVIKYPSNPPPPRHRNKSYIVVRAPFVTRAYLSHHIMITTVVVVTTVSLAILTRPYDLSAPGGEGGTRYTSPPLHQDLPCEFSGRPLCADAGQTSSVTPISRGRNVTHRRRDKLCRYEILRREYSGVLRVGVVSFIHFFPIIILEKPSIFRF